MAKKAQFCWDDPLLLDAQLTEDERMIRDAARNYCQGRLLPRITEAFRHERTDPAVFGERDGELRKGRDCRGGVGGLGIQRRLRE